MPFEDLAPEMLELARGPVGAPPTRDIAFVNGDLVEGVPERIYRGEGRPIGLLDLPSGGGDDGLPSAEEFDGPRSSIGGCDGLRDEGRAYATRLRDDGVEVEEVY